jgi:hypothetical protein
VSRRMTCSFWAIRRRTSQDAQSSIGNTIRQTCRDAWLQKVPDFSLTRVAGPPAQDGIWAITCSESCHLIHSRTFRSNSDVVRVMTGRNQIKTRDVRVMRTSPPVASIFFIIRPRLFGFVLCRDLSPNTLRANGSVQFVPGHRLELSRCSVPASCGSGRG